MTKGTVEFYRLPDETPDECVDRHLSETILNLRKQAVAFITSCRGEGNVKASDLAKIDGAMEALRASQRPVMLAQIEAFEAVIN